MVRSHGISTPSSSAESVVAAAAQRKARYYRLLYTEINERIRAERRASQRNDLLNALSRAHLRFVAHEEMAHVLADLARALLDLTGSEMCVIGEMRPGAPAAGRRAPDEQLHILATAVQGMPHDATYQQLTSLAWEAGLNRRAVARVFAPGAPGVVSFVGLPFRVEDAAIGVLALANRPEPYDDEAIELLQPAVSTCAHLLTAERNERRRRQAEKELAEERASLAQRVSERTAQLSATNAELAHALRIKEEFLATMNHELRTPLNTMLILAEVLQQEIFGPLNEKQKKNVQDIEESGRHLLALITEILDVVKINAGKLELDISTIQVRELCESSLRMTAAMADKKRIELSVKVAPDVADIDADDRRLKQMLVNLLSNAVKFTPEGGQAGMDVTGDAETNTVVFTVWDTGIGIAAEDMDKLFTPFAQIDSGLSRQYEGSGLGLALTARMANLCGGSIAVESEVDRGSRFMLSLPWRREDAAPFEILLKDPRQMAQEAQDEAERPNAQTPHRADGREALVLLAEDNEPNLNALRYFLEHQGYTLEVARTGREALELARSARPDIVLMDIQMPDMDGLEAIRSLRADPGLNDIPIVAVTALVLPGDRERCLAAGADDFIGKPISTRALSNAIAGLLQPQAMGGEAG
jgi:signal transduction histidine kinase/ActR/RegA family two-component response regulator